MSLKVYKVAVAPDEEGWIDWTARNLEETYTNSSTAEKLVYGATVAVAAVVLSPLIETAAVNVAVGAAVGSAVGGLFSFFSSDFSGIEIIDTKEKLAKFTHVQNKPFPNQIYIEHPHNNSTLVPVTDFHDIVVKEQIKNIITFLRSELLVSKLKVEVVIENGGGIGAQATTQGGDFSAKLKYKKNNYYLHESTYEKPSRIEPTGNLPWIDETFGLLKESVRGSRGGKNKFREKYDFTMGLHVDFAKTIGIEAAWLSTKEFIIEVEHG